MILRDYLPERQSADIVAGRIRFRFGDVDHVLQVLSIDENERWQERLRDGLAGLFADVGAIDNVPAVFVRFQAATQLQLDLLHAYDRDHVLPDDAAIRSTASPDALLRAVLEVLAAAYPTLAIALDMAARNEATLRSLVETGLATMATSGSTNGSPTNTAGLRPKRAAA